MNVAAELQWNLMPPSAYAGCEVTLGAVIEPAYEVGGDAFDYAISGSTRRRLPDGSPACSGVILARPHHWRRRRCRATRRAIGREERRLPWTRMADALERLDRRSLGGKLVLTVG
ncbi:hypothetical protein ACFXKI_45610 [Streptomyces mirabilis]|uniref:hypothetical protein n=1 Tax=Streptomyces mirabilis TaxID=68239 RepID=UPI0036B8776A